jgi:ribonucleoside-triphosphate reductase
MVPYVRKSFYKHYIDGLRYIDHEPEDWIGQTWNDLIDNNPSIDDTEIFAEHNAYCYAMDMTQKEIH